MQSYSYYGIRWASETEYLFTSNRIADIRAKVALILKEHNASRIGVAGCISFSNLSANHPCPLAVAATTDDSLLVVRTIFDQAGLRRLREQEGERS